MSKSLSALSANITGSKKNETTGKEENALRAAAAKTGKGSGESSSSNTSSSTSSSASSGVSSATNKINKLANAISGSNAATFNFDIPGMGLMKTEGETDPWVSLGAMAVNIAISATNVTQAIRSAYCVGQALSDPSMLLNIASGMASAAGAIAVDIAERCVKLVKQQIQQALSQINGVFSAFTDNVMGYIDGVRDFINSVGNLVKALDSFIDNFKINVDVETEEFMNKEACEFMFAMMAACLISNLLGNKLQEIEQKVTSKITNAGADLNEALADSLSGVSEVSGFVEREKFMLEKATKQVNGLHNLVSK